MLEKLCIHCHNHFIRNAYPGTYAIENGALALREIKEGQRFWICGSDLNDGVYTWHANGIKNDDDNASAQLSDETFNGTVLTMAPPRAFLELADEIAAWEAAYGAHALSPYQSENVIGVYSYTKKDSGAASDGGAADAQTWQGVFRSRLIPYMRTGEL